MCNSSSPPMEIDEDKEKIARQIRYSRISKLRPVGLPDSLLDKGRIRATHPLDRLAIGRSKEGTGVHYDICECSRK